jgi:hypothetical protein
MGKTVAVIQSNYIPWKGYFDIIHDVDEFVFYDDVQFTKNDWRNRNLIKTPRHTEWLSIPVGAGIRRLICEVAPADSYWQEKHWKALQQHYGAAPCFSRYKDFLASVYLERRWASLSELNQYLIGSIARDFLSIRTQFSDSRDYGAEGGGLERLLALLQKAGARAYVSGPAAKSYIEPERFEEAGIQLVWKDYGDYPEYAQFHPPFTHQVTVLDLLFQVGEEATWYIWGHRKAPLRPFGQPD